MVKRSGRLKLYLGLGRETLNSSRYECDGFKRKIFDAFTDLQMKGWKIGDTFAIISRSLEPQPPYSHPLSAERQRV